MTSQRVCERVAACKATMVSRCCFDWFAHVAPARAPLSPAGSVKESLQQSEIRSGVTHMRKDSHRQLGEDEREAHRGPLHGLKTPGKSPWPPSFDHQGIRHHITKCQCCRAQGAQREDHAIVRRESRQGASHPRIPGSS